MTRLCIFVGSLLGGYLFWFLADAAGLGLGGAFGLGGVGSLVGVYAGWKLARKLP
jgi:hypothetical protein